MAETSLASEQRNELDKPQGGALLQFSPEKVKVLKNTVAKGATDDELEMFLHLCSRYQLDPFAKEIWFVKRPKKYKDANGNWDYKRLPSGEIDYTGVEPVIMTSRDGYVKVAQMDPEFEELNSFEVRENDKFHFNPMTKEITHEIGSKRGRITGAWAVCKRNGREAAISLVDYDEYKKAAGNNPVWDSYPSAMIRKVAEVIVLKRQFNISGLVTQEEMPNQYGMDYEDPNIKRIEPNKNKAIGTNEKQATEMEWKRLSHKIKEKREILGLNSEQMKVLSEEELSLGPNPAQWTIDDLNKVINYLDAQLEKQRETAQEMSMDDVYQGFEESLDDNK